MKENNILYSSNMCLNIPKNLKSSVVSFPVKKIGKKKLFLDFIKQDTPLKCTLGIQKLNARDPVPTSIVF